MNNKSFHSASNVAEALMVELNAEEVDAISGAERPIPGSKYYRNFETGEVFESDDMCY